MEPTACQWTEAPHSIGTTGMAVEDDGGAILGADCSTTIGKKLIELVSNYEETMASTEQPEVEVGWRAQLRLSDGNELQLHNKGPLIVRFPRQATSPVEPVKLEAEEAEVDSEPPRNMVQVFRDKPGGLFSLASRLMDFEPSEHLPVQSDGQLGPTTTQMLHDIHAWTRAFQMSPQAQAFACGAYGKLLEAQFVASSNLSEEAGLPDLQSTMQALSGEHASNYSTAFRETTQLRDAMQLALAHVQDLDEQSVYGRVIVTPPVIEFWHAVLMHGILHNAGEVRTSEAFAGLPGGGVHYFAKPEVIPGLMLVACDLHNASMLLLEEQFGQVLSVEAIKGIYNAASLLFLHVVSIHPFSDGNGRIGRLLAAFVLRAVTPFFVTPHSDGSFAERQLFLDCIRAAQDVDVSSWRFMGLDPPRDLCALLVQAVWQSWRSFHEEFSKQTVLL